MAEPGIKRYSTATHALVRRMASEGAGPKEISAATADCDPPMPPNADTPREASVMAATQQIALPFPPSVNALRFGNGRAKPSYRMWKEMAGWEIKRQRITPVTGRVNISIALCAPDNRKRDCDNLIKAPMDLLVKMGVIADDAREYVRDARAHWVDDGAPCLITITQVEKP